ncbi:MAG: hypothetical protein Aurels2KO_29940 [Aureliella sp.]
MPQPGTISSADENAQLTQNTDSDASGDGVMQHTPKPANDAPQPTNDASPPSQTITTVPNSQQPQSPTQPSEPVGWAADAPLPSTVEELFTEAEATAEVMAKRFADLPDASELLARVYWVSGKPIKAESIWKNVLEVHPKYPYALHGLGQVAAKKGDLKSAAEYHWQAYQALPSYVDAAVEASTAWIKTGELQRATELLEKITSAYAKTALGWIRLGQAYTASRDFPKAEEAFSKALALSPNDVEAVYGFALAAARNGNREEAKQAKERHAVLRAADRQATLEERKTTDDLRNQMREVAAKYTSIGQMYFATKQYGVAEEIWNRASRLDPLNCDVREKLAGLHMGFQDAQSALAVCRELADLKPENTQYQLNLAMMLDRSGKQAEAIRLFEQVAKSTPSGQVYAMLADIHYRSGNAVDAKKSIEQAIEIEPDNAQWKNLRDSFTAPQ